MRVSAWNVAPQFLERARPPHATNATAKASGKVITLPLADHSHKEP